MKGEGKEKIAAHLGGGGRHQGLQAPQVFHQAALRHLDDVLAHVHALLAVQVSPEAHGRVALVVGPQVRPHRVLQLVLCTRSIVRPIPRQNSGVRALLLLSSLQVLLDAFTGFDNALLLAFC